MERPDQVGNRVGNFETASATSAEKHSKTQVSDGTQPDLKSGGMSAKTIPYMGNEPRTEQERKENVGNGHLSAVGRWLAWEAGGA